MFDFGDWQMAVPGAKTKEKWQEGEPVPEDYIFRYKLESNNHRRPLHTDRLTELFRAQLQNILNIVSPTRRGNEVKVDGFKWLKEGGTTFEIFPKNHGFYASSVDKEDEAERIESEQDYPAHSDK